MQIVKRRHLRRGARRSTVSEEAMAEEEEKVEARARRAAEEAAAIEEEEEEEEIGAEEALRARLQMASRSATSTITRTRNATASADELTFVRSATVLTPASSVRCDPILGSWFQRGTRHGIQRMMPVPRLRQLRDRLKQLMLQGEKSL